MRTKVNENTFDGQSIYVGIDTHLKSWKVTVMAGDVHYKTFSSPPKTDGLVNFLTRNFPGARYYSAYEAGFAGFWLHRELIKLGINSIVVNPADIPTTDKERKQKEDRRDSRKIAKTLQAGQLNGIFIPSERVQQDRNLVRTRDSVLKDLSRNKNRIKALLYFQGILIPERFVAHSNWSNAFIQWLRELRFDHSTGRGALDPLLAMVDNQRSLLLKITRQTRELSRTPNYLLNVDLLVSVPGIGVLTAMKLLTELENIERFKTFTQLCSYVGLVPSTNSSGENEVTSGITPRRNIRLRTALVESSWIAIRNDPALLSSYQTLCKKMSGNRAIIRIARKLLNRMVHVLRLKEKYERGVIK